MRTCARCRESKDESNFKPRNRYGQRKGLSSYCMVCEYNYAKTYQENAKPVYLYVLDYVPLDYCKIGVTQNLVNRLKDIRNVWPEAVYAALYDARCAMDVEKGILKLFSAARIGTSEVMKLNAKVVVSVLDASQSHFECEKLDIDETLTHRTFSEEDSTSNPGSSPMPTLRPD